MSVTDSSIAEEKRKKQERRQRPYSNNGPSKQTVCTALTNSPQEHKL